MSYVLNDTYTEINFYDIYGNIPKIVLYNNTYPLRLIWLSLLKAIKGHSIHSKYSDLLYIEKSINMKDLMYPYFIAEVVYYKDGDTQRYFIKEDTNLEKVQKILKNHPNLPHHNNKYLHASLCVKYNITNFINSHIFCFTKENNIKVKDVFKIYMDKFATEIVSDDKENHNNACYSIPIELTLLEDDTLEETTYYKYDSLVLYSV
jgi:hypothetical protein